MTEKTEAGKRLRLGPRTLQLVELEADGKRVTTDHLEKVIKDLEAQAGKPPCPAPPEQQNDLSRVMKQLSQMNELLASMRYMILALAASVPEDVQQAMEKLNRHLDGLQKDIAQEDPSAVPSLSTFFAVMNRDQVGDETQQLKPDGKGEIER